MALLLQRIIRSGSSLYLHLVRLDLKRLLRFRGSDESTCYNNGGAYVQLADLGEVLHGVMIYDLKRIEAGAVVEHDESESLGAAHAAHPASHGYLLIQESLPLFVDFFYGCKFHDLFPLCIYFVKRRSRWPASASLSSIAYSFYSCKEYLRKFTASGRIS